MNKVKDNPRTIGEWIQWVLWGPWGGAQLIGLLTLVFLIRTAGFGLYQVPTGSMETTMLVGDRFFADKFTYTFIREPLRGEIISMNSPTFKYSDNTLKYYFQYYVWGPENWTKRVIGIPGDHMRGAIEDGKPIVYLNDRRLNEDCYRNQYPLIKVLKIPRSHWLREVQECASELQIRARLEGKDISRKEIEQWCQQICMDPACIEKSYDPTVSWDEQPFYRMRSDQIVPAPSDPALSYPNDAWGSGRIADVVTESGRWNGSDIFDVKLGADEYWVMGDNRRGSYDSRALGPVNRRFIHGRIIFRIWSLDSDYSWFIVDMLKNPIDFFKRMRWSRFFQYLPSYDGMCDVPATVPESNTTAEG